MITTGEGIALGLAAAACQSLSYVFSRLFVIRRHNGVMQLLVMAHVLMGLASLVALPFLWSPQLPPPSHWAWTLGAVSLFYMLGQLGLFIALRYTDASRTAPLLGLKIAILAFISMLFLHEHMGVCQWLAVAMSVVAAFMLNYSGAKMPLAAVAAILFACITYSISDLNILLLVRHFKEANPQTCILGRLLPLSPATYSVLISVCMSYILCGLAGIALMPWAGKREGADWKWAAPFAAAWLTAMVFLFACFAGIGVVYGNIVQSTRGLISILLGAHIASLGFEHLEKRIAHTVLLKRIAAAALMTGAIALFYWK